MTIQIVYFQLFISPARRTGRNNSKRVEEISKFLESCWGAALKANQNAAHNALGRTDDEQFVVDGSRVGGVAEQVPQADEYFPARRVAERHERQRLVHLDVEPVVERRARRIVSAGERA